LQNESPSTDVKSFEDSIPLSKEQNDVLNLILKGKSVFLTGSAGTGKSFLLKRITQELKKKNIQVAVTASTGLAAVNIGGTTLHRWAGIGVSKNKHIQAAGAFKNKNRWKKTDVLIIDEVSMVSGQLFDSLEQLAREIRENKRPFGGIQLICVGDFFQLPPVRSPDEPSTFCFEGKSWDRSIQHIYSLKTVFRQSDSKFIEMLNDIRIGECNSSTKEILDSRKNANNRKSKGILPTVLFSKNVQVDSLNQKHLQQLKSDPKKFASNDFFYSFSKEEDERKDDMKMKSMLDSCLAQPIIDLKKGAQVMLVRNISPTLVNGSRGVVVGFEELNALRKDALKDKGGNFDDWISSNTHLPIVEFANGETQVIEPIVFRVESFSEGIATRVQIPLKLAYALTIHKSQGLTIDCADVSLGGVFEYGQAYVALSRIKGIEGLKLLDWNPQVVRAHPKVLEFYEKYEK